MRREAALGRCELFVPRARARLPPLDLPCLLPRIHFSACFLARCLCSKVMGPNGVSHSVVKDDQEGVAAIMEWLSFVPKTADDQPAALADVADDIDRKV